MRKSFSLRPWLLIDTDRGSTILRTLCRPDVLRVVVSEAMARRSKRIGISALAVLGLVCSAGGHTREDCPHEMVDGARIESPHYAIWYRTEPNPIRVGEPFVVDFAVCGTARLPIAVRLDAVMPAHLHGMNYVPTVTALGGIRFRAEGLLFHMPGQWEMRFDVVAGQASERLTTRIELQ